MASGRLLWATICEIEPGLFQVIYSNTGSASGERDLPIYETGVDVKDAKRCFEQAVQVFGYTSITWVEVNVADLVLPRPGSLPNAAGRASSSF